MVGGRTDDGSQLQEPLLADSRRNFSFGWKHNPSQSRFESGSADDPQKHRRLRAQSKRRLRNPVQKKSYVKRAAHSATHDPAYFLKNLAWGIVLWPRWAWAAIQSQQKLTVLSLKAGIAAGLASILCVVKLPEWCDDLSGMAIWAIVTIDILAESNVGLSLSKGVNRIAGTLSAGALAVVLTQLGPDIPKIIYPYYVVFWVTFGGFVFRFLKGIPPLKDQWGYAFTVATMTFHILLIADYQEPENVTLPIVRFCMILFGFFLSALVGLLFKPVYAGDALHTLVAKNFDTAADVLSRCVKEYCNFTMLDHLPDIRHGRSEDDKIHQSYHEIVMSDSDVDKLLGAVTWEPCHGKFFNGYPWHLYDDITDILRYTLYDIIALDSSLRASIQAPKSLRDIFSQEMNVIAVECANVLHTLAESMRNMSKFPSEDILCRAEEAALALQNKIYNHTHLLLGRNVINSPRYPFYVSSGLTDSDPWAAAEPLVTDSLGQESDHHKMNHDNLLDPLVHSYTSSGHSLRYNSDDNDVSHPSFSDYSAPLPILQQHDYHRDSSIGTTVHDNCSSEEIEHILNFSPREAGSGLSVSMSEHQYNLASAEVNSNGKREVPGEKCKYDGPVRNLRVRTEASEIAQGEKNSSHPSKPSGVPTEGWKENFIQRRASLGRNWEGTLERVSALSLVKFAALLIEVVAKMKFVVDSVDELSVAARFEENMIPEYTGSVL